METGAKVIAIVGFVFKALGLAASLVAMQWLAAPLEVAGMLAYGLILLAQKKRKPKFYVPYLVVNAIYIALGVIAAVLVLLAAIAASTRPTQVAYPGYPGQIGGFPGVAVAPYQGPGFPGLPGMPMQQTQTTYGTYGEWRR